MFSVKAGKPIAGLRGGTHGDKVLGVVDVGDEDALGRDIELKRGCFEPILSLEDRSVDYIAGPSGAGKSTYTADLVRKHNKLNPEAKVILYSRSPIADDKAFADIAGVVQQATLGSDLIANPLDVTTLEKDTLLVFDDVGTIFDEKLKQAVQKVIMDVAETGRKYKVYLVVTSHLINPNDRGFARVMMNEMEFLTLFPGSGNAHSITYVLKKYLGLGATQIRRILDTKSRWVRIHTHAPRWVLEEHAAYIL